MNILTVNSPDDCFVEKLLVSAGDVKKGDALAMLYSPKVSSFGALNELFAEEIVISKRQFQDGRRQKNRELTEESLTDAKDEENDAQSALSLVEEAYLKSLVGQEEVDSVTEKKVKADTSFDQLTEEEFKFDRETRDNLDKISLAESFLKEVTGVLDDFKSRLSIVAPIAGRFTANVAESGFIKKGEALGTIKPL
jgi:biotin carboxyl carrier protein